MIPGFNKDGNLPEGIYSTGEEEFLDRFATNSSRRKWLGQRLQLAKILFPFGWIPIKWGKTSDAEGSWR
jgi:hypothetical protein